MLRLLGGRLLVSPFSLVLLLILSLSPDAPFFAIALLFALLHELSHAVTMRLCGAELNCISVYPFGIDIRMNSSGLSYKGEALCAASGPIMSLILSALFFAFLCRFKSVYILSAALSNAFFFLVNILPVRGLDGGRVLLSLLLSRLEYSLALRIFDVISAVAFALLCLAALALLYASGYNISLVFICVYLFISEYVRSKFFI